jgi:hypothetical protein
VLVHSKFKMQRCNAGAQLVWQVEVGEVPSSPRQHTVVGSFGPASPPSAMATPTQSEDDLQLTGCCSCS